MSKEDQNSVGPTHVDEKTLEGLRERASKTFASSANASDDRDHDSAAQSPIVAIVDGFLLFSEEMAEIRDLFDVKLFLRTDYATAKRRRETRSGYVTLEGFWEDPPGYVDKIVWPNYVKDHAFLFRESDVNGALDSSVCDRLGIHAMPDAARGDMTACVKWAYDNIEKACLERK